MLPDAQERNCVRRRVSAQTRRGSVATGLRSARQTLESAGENVLRNLTAGVGVGGSHLVGAMPVRVIVEAMTV